VRIEPVAKEAERFRVIVGDNGPGIVAEQIDNVFARLLYGSKFHRLRQSRGQQGIGISAAGMYGQMTTGAPTIIKTRIGKKHPGPGRRAAHRHGQERADQAAAAARVRMGPRARHRGHDRARGRVPQGQGSVDEYLAQVAIANPHVQLLLAAGPREERAAHRLRARHQAAARAAKEIQPHPHGVELGFLMKMMKDTDSTRLGAFLHADFSRVSRASRRRSARRRSSTPPRASSRSGTRRPRRSTRRSTRPSSWRRPRTASRPSART
jgi:DNA topoisomerase-6 subunit B